MLVHRSGPVWSARTANRIMRITALIKSVCSLLLRSFSNRAGLTDVWSDTYNAPYPDGTIAQGGYSSHVRAHEYFTFKIPDNIPSEDAAPMMCAGLTTWSPLVRAGAGPGKKIAVLGMWVVQLGVS